MNKIRKNIAKYIGFPLQDYVKRTNIIETLSLLRESQYWEETRIEEYRLEKFKNLIAFAHRNVPYYEKLFDSIKLNPNDIKHLEDANKIPILTKEIVRRENMNLIARNFDMKYVKKGKTGGTTGAPIIVLKDVKNRSFTWASYYRWYEWMGIEYSDREATFWGSRNVLTNSVKKRIIDFFTNYLQNNLAINAFNMNDEDLHNIFHVLVRFNPQIIKGYLSALLQFAKFMEVHSLDDLHPKVISSTSEMLLPLNRSYLEKIFKVPIFDQYGCGELSAISYECAKHNGLHINQEHILFEILDNNGLSVVGDSGRVIATDLDNCVMPFIRYENGDLATLSNQKCSCGVNQPLMSSIDGRAIDTITLKNGSPVHGVFFTDILYELGILTKSIQRFQVYQSEPGSIEFRYEVIYPPDIQAINKIKITLLQFFNKVYMIETKKLFVEENGKFKYIINDTKAH